MNKDYTNDVLALVKLWITKEDPQLLASTMRTLTESIEKDTFHNNPINTLLRKILQTNSETELEMLAEKMLDIQCTIKDIDPKLYEPGAQKERLREIAHYLVYATRDLHKVAETIFQMKGYYVSSQDMLQYQNFVYDVVENLWKCRHYSASILSAAMGYLDPYERGMDSDKIFSNLLRKILEGEFNEDHRDVAATILDRMIPTASLLYALFHRTKEWSLDRLFHQKSDSNIYKYARMTRHYRFGHLITDIMNIPWIDREEHY